ncbi:MAG: Gfo/Idh/MocA family oxidoreductase [Thermomicrobiales bacterium]|nr:Gfo/Idh/MocA family oxidoreductase [Thermomicrobiales bacterium]
MRVIAAGLGSFGKSWAEIVRDGEQTELVAVVEPGAENRAWALEHLGLAEGLVFGTIEEALTGVETDAVLVVTPPETHLAVAAAALRAGKHVLVEKPLAPTLEEARAAVREADDAGRILMVSQNYRFRPAARAIQRLVREGAIGPLVSASLDCQRDMRPSYEATNFRYQMRHPYVIDMSIHHFDLIRALTGENVTSIHARSWRVPDSPYRHDPAMAALVTLESGVTLLYEGSGATYRPWTSWNGDWELVGERGRITWTGGVEDAELGVVTLHCWGEEPVEVEQDHSGPQGRELVLELFRQATLTGQEPETSARDNVNSLALVLACAASIDRGGPVEIAELLG